MTPPHRGQCSRAGLAFTNQTLVGGLDETSAVPSGRPARPEAASSVALVASGYEHSLRPCLGTISAPRGRARFRQALLGTGLPYLFHRAVEARGHGVPVDDVPPRLQVLRAPVLVLEV